MWLEVDEQQPVQEDGGDRREACERRWRLTSSCLGKRLEVDEQLRVKEVEIDEQLPEKEDED